MIDIAAASRNNQGGSEIIMKKKIVLIMAFVFALSMALSGCGSGGGSTSGGKVKLAENEYKGIEVPRTDPVEVTDEDVEAEIEDALYGISTQKDVDRKAKEGDIVNLDFQGTVDGKEFDGGSGEDQQITLGEEFLFEGFDDKVIGHKAGDEYDFTLHIDDEFLPDDIDGNDVKFKVTIKNVKEEKVPELSDKVVSELSDTAKTVDEYKKEVKENLVKDAEEEAKTTMQNDALEIVVGNAEVSEYDQERLDQYVEETTSYYKETITDMYGMSFDDYLKEMDQTEEEFKEGIVDECKDQLKSEMVLEYIANKENLELTDKEREEFLQQYLDMYEFEDKDAFYLEYGTGTGIIPEDTKKLNDEMKAKVDKELDTIFLQQKTMGWIVDNATLVEPSEDEDEGDEDDIVLDEDDLEDGDIELDEEDLSGDEEELSDEDFVIEEDDNSDEEDDGEENLLLEDDEEE